MCIELKNILQFCKILLILQIEPVMARMQWHSLYDHALLTFIRILEFFINREEKSSSHDCNREKVMGRIWDKICVSFRKIMILGRGTCR